MARRMRLSDHGVARLRAASSEYTIWDTRMTGLGVRVRPSGHRSFVLLNDTEGTSKRLTLGPVAHMTVDEARSRCLAIQSGDDDGSTENSAIPAPLFGDFVANVWRSECFDRMKPSTQRTTNYIIANQLVPTFGDLPLGRIGREEVNRWFDRYSETAPGGANRALDALCQILHHAGVHGHLKTNPASGVRRNPQRRINRFLSREESKRLHCELDRLVAERPERAAQADIIRLLYYSGCRCSEIRTLKWCEVGSGVLDLVDSKTGPRKVYLNSESCRIIERQPRTGSAYVFPSPSDPSLPISSTMRFWFTLRKRAGVEDVRLHDLRHNFASQAVLNGVLLPTVARLLGHRQVSMTLRYAHIADHDVEAAAERIGDAISAICVEEESC